MPHQLRVRVCGQLQAGDGTCTVPRAVPYRPSGGRCAHWCHVTATCVVAAVCAPGDLCAPWQTLNLTDSAGTVFLNGDISFLGADLVAGNSTVGPESGLSLLSDLVQIAIVDFALPAINAVRPTCSVLCLSVFVYSIVQLL